MTTLYVTEPGAQVKKADERLVVTKGKTVLEDIPIIKVDQVILMGRGVSVTTPALYALTQRGVEVVYQTAHGRPVGRWQGPEHKHGRLRRQQALIVSDSKWALVIAGNIVQGKVSNQRTLVRRHAEGATWAGRALAGMEAMSGRVASAKNLDELRGLEGQAAKEYFGLLRRMLKPPADGKSWGFERRAYYPPPDPVNAMLSFGYTLLLNELLGACQKIGLDPYLGFFHVVDYGRPSLALDLEEEFRAIIVDSVVLTAINRGMIGLKDFERMRDEGERRNDERPLRVTKDEGQMTKGEEGEEMRMVLMTEAARKKFIGLYEARVNEQALYPPTEERTTYRRIFELQAQQMARVILGEAQEYRTVEVK